MHEYLATSHNLNKIYWILKKKMQNVFSQLLEKQHFLKKKNMNRAACSTNGKVSGALKRYSEMEPYASLIKAVRAGMHQHF